MELDKIHHLYWHEGLSTRQIGEKLGVSQWSVVAKMRKLKIPRRKPHESLKIRFDKSPLSFNMKTQLTDYEKELKSSGLMLYWAEGEKALHGRVDFSNCNPEMVTIFLSMLRRVYGVNENKLRAFLYCYSNQNIPDIISFWAAKLKLPKSQFSKPYIRYDFKIDKIGKMNYGLIHIRYNDKRLHQQILRDIDIISNKLS